MTENTTTQPTGQDADNFAAASASTTAFSWKTNALVAGMLIVGVVVFAALRGLQPQRQATPSIEGGERAVQGAWFCAASDPSVDGGVDVTSVAVPERGVSRQQVLAWSREESAAAADVVGSSVLADVADAAEATDSGETDALDESGEADPQASSPDALLSARAAARGGDTDAAADEVPDTIEISYPLAVELDPSDETRITVRAATAAVANVITSVQNPDGPVGRAVGGVGISWEGQPAVASRSWTPTLGDRVPAAVSGRCVSRASSRWIVPGLTTEGSGQASLFIANPFDTPAAVNLTLTTNTGPLRPQALQAVSIRPGSTLAIDLADHAPAYAAVGVIVEATVGRTVVEAVQAVDAAIGDVDGVALVPATAASFENQTFAFAAQLGAGLDGAGKALNPDSSAIERVDFGAVSNAAGSLRTAFGMDDGDTAAAAAWVWITNPDEQDGAAITVTGHSADGPVALSSPGVLIPPLTTVRLELPVAFIGGVSVRTDNDVPIAASVGTGIATSTGTGWIHAEGLEPEPEWLIPLSRTPSDRELVVVLTNPTGADIDVNVRPLAHSSRPGQSASTVSVPAGSWRTVIVGIGEDREADPDADAEVPLVMDWALVRGVHIEASGPVVASVLTSAPQPRLDLLDARLFPAAGASTWTAQADGPQVVRDSRIVRITPTTGDVLLDGEDTFAE